MTSTDYETYRGIYNAFDLQPGPEATGIFDREMYDAITADDRTITADILGMEVPILADMTRLEFVNVNYYRALTGSDSGSPALRLVTVPLALASERATISEISAATMDQPDGLLIAYDYATTYGGYKRTPGNRHALALPSAEEQKFITRLVEAGLHVTDMTRPEDVHYHFVEQLTHSSGSTNDQPVVEALNNHAGIVKQDLDTGLTVSIDPEMTDADIAAIWEFYDPAHQGISSVDPVMPGFNKSELAAALQSPEYIKSVCRVGNTILNVLILVDARNCSWAEPRYFEQQSVLREKYANGQTLFGAGVVSNFSAMRGLELATAASIETIGAAGKRFVDVGIEPAIVVTCNKSSHFKVKPASVEGLTRNGVRSTFPLPSVQRFGAILLQAN